MEYTIPLISVISLHSRAEVQPPGGRPGTVRPRPEAQHALSAEYTIPLISVISLHSRVEVQPPGCRPGTVRRRREA